MAAGMLSLAVAATLLQCGVEAAKLAACGIGVRKLARVYLTSASTLPLSFPLPGRPKRSSNR
jgi:hypothetical protein